MEILETAVRPRPFRAATVFGPALLKYELANTALKKVRRHKPDTAKIPQALSRSVRKTAGPEGPAYVREQVRRQLK